MPPVAVSALSFPRMSSQCCMITLESVMDKRNVVKCGPHLYEARALHRWLNDCLFQGRPPNVIPGCDIHSVDMGSRLWLIPFYILRLFSFLQSMGIVCFSEYILYDTYKWSGRCF